MPVTPTTPLQDSPSGPTPTTDSQPRRFSDFATLGEAFLRFGSPEGHLALDLTVSANSPTAV